MGRISQYYEKASSLAMEEVYSSVFLAVCFHREQTGSFSWEGCLGTKEARTARGGERACGHPHATLTRITDRFHCLPICPDTMFRKASCAPGGTLLLP